MQRVLVIDDDESLRNIVGILLESEGFTPFFADNGQAGLERALIIRPDLLVVDLRMPGITGFDVCRRLRASGVQTPIVVISAVEEEFDKVLLLEMGADDYLVKPFGSRELVARIRAVLRRTKADEHNIMCFSDLEVDSRRQVVTRQGKELKFTPAEYKLLTFFLKNADRVLTRDDILDSVWGYSSYPSGRTVDAHVARLRKKLEKEPQVPRHFLTVHGVGYRFLP